MHRRIFIRRNLGYTEDSYLNSEHTRQPGTEETSRESRETRMCSIIIKFMKNTLKENIFSKIEKENIRPIPESYFVKRQKILWISISMFLLFAVIIFGFLFDDTAEFFSL